MKNIIAVLLLAASSCLAQTNPAYIRGPMDIKYNSRVAPGGLDVYTLNLNVSGSAVFRGNITNTPVQTGMLSRVTRPASMEYGIDCDVINPANPSQVKNVGRLYGVVPISPGGVYNFNAGSMKVSVYPMGRAQGFESKFLGTAAGKPLVKNESFLNKIKREAQTITRNIGGKTVGIIVKRSDDMKFNNYIMGAGPVQYYPSATVNGTMTYDYDRYCWFFRGLEIASIIDGKQLVDKIDGNIRWIEQPRKGAMRDGEYQFDVRVNETPPTVSDVFAGATDEASFFQTDNTIAALTGTMKYKDSFNGDAVSGSIVSVELTGNKLTRQQCMNLFKLILITAIVPLNAE